MENTEMMKVPYASAVIRLMYVMMCTKPDIGYVVGAMGRGQVDTLVPERHLEHVPPIRLR